jgi:hypothetical protein
VGRGELEAPARVLCEPVGDLLRAVGGGFVTDRNDFPAPHDGDLGVELGQEADQIVAVASLWGHCEHVTFVDFQTGEQALRAVALIFVLEACHSPGSGQDVGFGRGLGLDAGLFVQG